MADLFRRGSNRKGSPPSTPKKKGLFSRGSSKHSSPATSSPSSRVGQLPSRSPMTSKSKSVNEGLSTFVRSDSVSSTRSLPVHSSTEQLSSPISVSPTPRRNLSPEAQELLKKQDEVRAKLADKKGALEVLAKAEEDILSRLVALEVSHDTERRNTISRERRMTASRQQTPSSNGTGARENGMASSDEEGESEKVWSQSQDPSDDEERDDLSSLNGGPMVYGRLGTGTSAMGTPVSSTASTPRRRMSSMSPGMRPSLNRGRRTVRLVRKTPGETLGFTLKTVALPKDNQVPNTDGKIEYYEPTFINEVHVGGLSHQAGLRAGDQILAVDGEPCELSKHSFIVELIQKNNGTLLLTVQYTNDFQRARLHKSRINKMIALREKKQNLQALSKREAEIETLLKLMTEKKERDAADAAAAAAKAKEAAEAEAAAKAAEAAAKAKAEAEASQTLQLNTSFGESETDSAASSPAKSPSSEFRRANSDRKLPSTPATRSLAPPPPSAPLPPTPGDMPQMPTLPDLPDVEVDFCTFQAVDSPSWEGQLLTLVKLMQKQWQTERQIREQRERLLVSAVQSAVKQRTGSPVPAPRSRAQSLTMVKRPVVKTSAAPAGPPPQSALPDTPPPSGPPPSVPVPPVPKGNGSPEKTNSPSPLRRSSKPPLAPKPASLAGKSVTAPASDAPTEALPPPPSVAPPPPPSDVKVLTESGDAHDNSFA